MEEVFTAKAGEELLGIGDWLLGEENEEAASSSQLEHLVPSHPWSGPFGMLMPYRWHFFSIAKRTWHDRSEAKAKRFLPIIAGRAIRPRSAESFWKMWAGRPRILEEAPFFP